MKRLIFFVFTGSVLIGCIGGVSSPTQFYSLDSDYYIKGLTEQKPANRISIGLGPISLPDSLNRPQIVTREYKYKINIAEFNRWAGDLKDNMKKLLLGNLMQGLQTNQVSQYPWPNHATPDYQLRIDILDFVGFLGEKVEFKGTWTLISSDRNKDVQIYSFSFTEKLANDSYETLVASMSKLVVLLAQQIVGVIKAEEKK
ncbi:MAG: membrane integrity-associated transporter subunit PqiC [Thiohalomonadales bacterium]